MAYIGDRIKIQFYLLAGVLFFIAICWPATFCLADLPATIDRVKPSIVGVGTVQKTRRPPYKIVGTGFVVAGGNYVITNAHVIPRRDQYRQAGVSCYIYRQRQTNGHSAGSEGEGR